MTARDRALQHKPVGAAGRLAHQVLCQHRRRHDRQEPRPSQRRCGAPQHLCRVHTDGRAFAGKRCRDRDAQFDAPSRGKSVQQSGNFRRDARAHEDVIDSGEHGAKHGGRRGELVLLQIVHTDHAIVTLLGEEDLGEGADDRQLRACQIRVDPQHENQPEGLSRWKTTVYKIAAQYPLGDLGDGEVGQRPAQLATRVTAL